MKNENSKLLLGLGIGAVVGITVGYLLNTASRHQLEHKMCEMGNEIKEGAKTVFSEVKSKAEQAGEKVAEKAEEKAKEWADEAEHLSQKAHDWKQKMEQKTTDVKNTKA